jgi:serine/threonine protein kinase, bacterial
VDGTLFGRYRLVELLGRGGMGEVWRAHDTATDRVVAVKLLAPHLADDPTFVQRFRREAHAAARLRSPHVIPIHNYGDIDGRLYVDMRLIDGRDLGEVLTDGPMPPARAVRIIEQVAKALHAAHHIGLVHRDVKPSNILLDDDDFAYLIDFGIASAAGETKLTNTGGLIGSLHYMAPERFSTGTADARADIYALACVLYECLTGAAPFPGDSLEQQLAGHLTLNPPTPSDHNPAIPTTFDEVIDRGMAKQPDHRYATTVELANAAHHAITTHHTPNQPPHPPLRAAPPQPRPTPPQPLLQQPNHPNQPPPAQPPPPNWPPVPPTGHPWWQRPVILIPAAALLVVAVVGAFVIANRQPGSTTAPQTAQAALPSNSQPPKPTYGPQVTLPFTGITSPWGIAVDSADTVYVTEAANNQVLKLAAGVSSALPFTGLDSPSGVAVDAAGDLYVTNITTVGSKQVLKLEAGSGSQTTVPFTGLNSPGGVAVDTEGALYVTDVANSQVLRLAAGSADPTVLPFSGLHGPTAVAVDAAGDVYVSDQGDNRVLELPAGSATPTVLPFTGLGNPRGLAVDAVGNLYVTDELNSRVWILPAGSPAPTVLPFTILNSPTGVAVDKAGAVYVTDFRNGRVVKLPVG